MRREELYSASVSSSASFDFDLDFVKGVNLKVKKAVDLFKFKSATRAATSWLWQSLTKACESEGKPALLEDKKVLIAGCVLGAPE